MRSDLNYQSSEDSPSWLKTSWGMAISTFSRSHCLSCLFKSFSAVFVALGAFAGAFGFFVQDHLSTLGKIAGVLLIVLGLNLLGILRIPWLSRTYQFDFANSPGGGEKG